MRIRTAALAAVAAVAALGAAPAAHAYGGLGCGLGAMQDDAFGQPAFGSMSGGPFTDTGPVAIRCFLRIDGVESTATTPTGSGTGVAVTSGQVTFAADDLNVVEACTEVTVPSGTQTYCYVVPVSVVGTTTYWTLSQPVI